MTYQVEVEQEKVVQKREIRALECRLVRLWGRVKKLVNYLVLTVAKFVAVHGAEDLIQVVVIIHLVVHSSLEAQFPFLEGVYLVDP